MEQKKQRFASVRRTSASSEAIVPDGFLQGKSKWKIPANQKLTILIDQGILTTAYPELTVSGGKSSQIKLIYSEALFDSEGDKGNRNEIEGKQIKGYADIFLPDGEANRLFRPLWFRTWRYLQLEIESKDEELIIDNFDSEFTAYPLQEYAVFESEQAKLKQIWKV